MFGRKNMQKIIKSTIIFIFVIVLGTCLIPSISKASSGTDTIREDYHVGHPISFHSGTSISISYTVQVTSGPDIDIYFVDSTNYVYLNDGREFEYYSALTDEHTSYSKNQATFTEYGDYYLVFDNSDLGPTDPPWNFADDVAYADYTINTQIYYPPQNENNWNYVTSDNNNPNTTGFELMFGVLAILLIILVLVLFLSFYKRK
jgi:hypothetical protein